VKKAVSLLLSFFIVALSTSCGRTSGITYYSNYLQNNESKNDLGIPNSPSIKINSISDLEKEYNQKDNDDVLIAGSLLFGGNQNETKSIKNFYLELQEQPIFINKLFEPSALCFDSEGRLYTVADKGYFSIFELERVSSGYNAKNSISINKSQLLKLRFKKRHKFDFEGLEYNPNNKLFYLADERDRKVFTVDREGNINELPIDVNSYLKTNKIKNSHSNSGLEGLTLDAKNNKLFLIKEMNESLIIVVDLNNNKIEKHFKVNLPGRVEPALTDASFFDGYLYVLIRSHRLIAKLNPETGEVLATYDYRKHEENNKNVYIKIPTVGNNHDKDGYGVMEGLAVTNDKFYIVTDNNMLPLKSNFFKNLPQLLILNRPDK